MKFVAGFVMGLCLGVMFGGGVHIRYERYINDPAADPPALPETFQPFNPSTVQP